MRQAICSIHQGQIINDGAMVQTPLWLPDKRGQGPALAQLLVAQKPRHSPFVTRKKWVIITVILERCMIIHNILIVTVYIAYRQPEKGKLQHQAEGPFS